MARNQLTVTDQTRPAEVLNRKFINRTRAFQVSKVIDDTQKRPVGDANEVLAVVAVALIRLRAAQIGAAQANDTTLAGSVSSWNNELTAAKAAADIALQGLKNQFPEIVLPQAVIDAINANVAGTIAPGPSQLDPAWAAAILAQPSAY
jgi:hypothetical protein